MKIAVVGLGKIGACIFATLASKGFNVVGIDINKEVVDKINKGESPYYEPGLEELLKNEEYSFIASTNHSEIRDTDLTIIMVPTPSTVDGGFSTEYVEKAVLEVGRNIPDYEEYHNVVINCTVLPGSMEKIKPILERACNRKVGERLGLCYTPEFVALGSIVKNLLDPEFIVIGESDKKAGHMVESMYRQLIEGYAITSIHHMSLYNAELTKIGLNAYVAMKMSFANTIAEICENMPTGNATHVLNAIGTDTRVGKKFFKPGLSYGGTCFPRDSRAFIRVAQNFGAQGLISQMSDVVNIHIISRITSKLMQKMSKLGTNKISILGLTFKPDTTVVEESASLKIIQRLLKEGIEVRVYDPAIKQGIKARMPIASGLIFTHSIEQCLQDAELCFIAVPWEEFQSLTKQDFLNYMKVQKPSIIDAWGIQNHLQHDTDIDYEQIGIHRS